MTDLGDTSVTETWRRFASEGNVEDLEILIRRLENRLRSIASWEVSRHHSVRYFDGDGTQAVSSLINEAIIKIIAKFKNGQLDQDVAFTVIVRGAMKDYLAERLAYLGRKGRLEGSKNADREIDCPASEESEVFGAVLVADLEDLVSTWDQKYQYVYNWMLEEGPRKASRKIADELGISIKTARRYVAEVQSRVGKYFEASQ